MIREYEEVQDYLNQVCSKVRAREVHQEIREELISHIEELVLTKEADGSSKEKAVPWALRQMGDPAQVGGELHKIHRPRLNWVLLAAVRCCSL
ncbi:permease prefix domain 1-containing protein [Paenibacillus sp. S-38]|uniref:permease prefix domain 1-containing protein n=1 Tax=Paenibacillus sp. S-38 TaxID=3416710 RepID=UPI003CEFAB23